MTGREIDINLHKCYSKLLDIRFGSDSYSYDSIGKQNIIFRKEIQEYTSRYPFTISYKFDSLLSDKIDIVTSGDGLFRIYSWDTWLGGTEHDFENVWQYKFGDKVYSKSIYDTIRDADNGYVYYYSDIFNLKKNNKAYYLAIKNGIFSSRDASEGIKVFCLEDGKLNDTVRVIKTTSGLQNEIDFGFDFFSVVDRPERPLKLIKYDSIKKIIYIPVVLEDGKVTKKYIRYKFTGEYFEKIGKEE